VSGILWPVFSSYTEPPVWTLSADIELWHMPVCSRHPTRTPLELVFVRPANFSSLLAAVEGLFFSVDPYRFVRARLRI